jgi:hypothetical protein
MAAHEEGQLPELPEVAAMLSGLAPEIKGRSFIGLEALRREVTKMGVQNRDWACSPARNLIGGPRTWPLIGIRFQFGVMVHHTAN